MIFRECFADGFDSDFVIEVVIAHQIGCFGMKCDIAVRFPAEILIVDRCACTVTSVQIFIKPAGVMKHRCMCEYLKCLGVLSAHLAVTHVERVEQHPFAMAFCMQRAVGHVEFHVVVEKLSPFGE